MRDLTRRAFLHTVAGAAAGGAIIGHDAFLYGDGQDVAANSDSSCAGECSPLEALIFPKPQEISASGSDFVLDSQVRVVVPSDASEQDLLLAGLLVNELGDGYGLHLKIERVTKWNRCQ